MKNRSSFSRTVILGVALLVAAFGAQPSALSQSQPSSPIIVKIIEPAKSELSGLSDVLIGSLGLAGAITLAALLMGVLMAGLMFWLRSRT